jgi:hypothetical protein
MHGGAPPIHGKDGASLDGWNLVSGRGSLLLPSLADQARR